MPRMQVIPDSDPEGIDPGFWSMYTDSVDSFCLHALKVELMLHVKCIIFVWCC